MTDLTDDQVKALLDEMTFAMFGDGTDDTISEKLARALLAARAELAEARADAQAAVALVVEQAVMDLPKAVGAAAIKWCGEKDRETFQSDIEYFRTNWRALPGLRDYVLRALAPADGLAAVDALRAEARENAMQALASMGQAQEAYEAQLEAEAELARLRDRERVLADFIAEFAAAKIDALRYQPAYGESPEDAPDPVVEAETVWAWQEDARAALAQTTTDPGDGWTWNERLGWIGPDGKPADPRRRG